MKISNQAKALFASVALVAMSACTEAETQAEQEEVEVADNLWGALSDTGEHGKLSEALENSGLSNLLEEDGSYTLLAPTDSAFDELGDTASQLFADENSALLAATLRNHFIPGHLTLDAIKSAAEDNGGSVTITTLGEGDVTFRTTDSGLEVAMPDGAGVPITGSAVESNNGVLISVPTVIRSPEPVQ